MAEESAFWCGHIDCLASCEFFATEAELAEHQSKAHGKIAEAEAEAATTETGFSNNYSGTCEVNQETERVFEVLYEIYANSSQQGTPEDVGLPPDPLKARDIWIRINDITGWMCGELGYEDADELEDALGGSFTDWMKSHPLIDVTLDDKGREQFQVILEPLPEEWVPRRYTLHITERSQLWNVLFKSRHATFAIPEIEFEIYPEGHKHKSDALYNHIANAMNNLERDMAFNCADVIESLQKVLDVEEPFTVIVEDHTGFSFFSDNSRVKIEVVPGLVGSIRG